MVTRQAVSESEGFRAGPALSVPAGEPPLRHFTRDDLAGETALFHTLSANVIDEIAAGLAFCKANGLTVDTVEQEDVRLPTFARDVPELRDRLDTGRGFLVIRGLDAEAYDEPEAEIVAWVLANYLGRPIRQGIGEDRRFFTVADKELANPDPTRIGASAKRSPKHSDNGCLEPRPPAYLALYCHRSALEGGDNTIISARTIYETIMRERPDLLSQYLKTYHFRAPRAHVWPSRGPTVEMPILEADHGELRVHYARVMVEPGMEMAGTPLSDAEREALDYLDEVVERPELNLRYCLKPGEMLVLNNLALLHGREAFPPGKGGGRTLKRLWMWRRHLGPGDDPVALDAAELA